jgi:hypothetical protein
MLISSGVSFGACLGFAKLRLVRMSYELDLTSSPLPEQSWEGPTKTEREKCSAVRHIMRDTTRASTVRFAVRSGSDFRGTGE